VEENTEEVVESVNQDTKNDLTINEQSQEMASLSLGVFTERGDPSDLGARWEDWNERFELYTEVKGITDGKKLKSEYLLLMGEEAYAIYKTKRKTTKDDTLDEIKTFMKNHYVVKKCAYTENMIFRRAIRLEGETVTQYATRLEKLSTTCVFANTELDGNLEKQFVFGIRMDEVERQCCLQDDLDFKKAVAIGLKYESLNINVNGLHKPTTSEMNGRQAIHQMEESVNHLNKSYSHRNGRQNEFQKKNDNKYDKCSYCGRSCHKSQESCTAKGQKCKVCDKMNHYAAFCRSKDNGTSSNATHNKNEYKNKKGEKIGCLSSGNDSEFSVNKTEYDEFMRFKNNKWLGAVHGRRIHRINNDLRAIVEMEKQGVNFLVDTGSPVNVIDKATLDNLKTRPKLVECHTKFFGYTSDIPLKILGQFVTDLEFQGKRSKAGFIVIDGQEECLMSYITANQLGIIHMWNDRIFTLKDGQSRCSPVELKEKFPELFSGKLGCLKGVKVKLDLDPTIKPVKQAQRPVAFHLRDAVESEIKKQIDLGILEYVTDEMGPTPWVANLVIVPKDKEVVQAKDGSIVRNKESCKPMEIRLTVDNRAQNKAIRRTKYPGKTIEDLVYAVNGGKYFSKLDVTKAFHQMLLDEESRNHTCITTHLGLLRYVRMHMGISCAQEYFTENLRRVLLGLNGQLNMTDDILVWGGTEKEHHDNLMAVLSRLEKSGLTLNLEKCEFYKKELVFFGLRFTEDGISPTEDRCQALKDARAPTDAKDLHSFLCTAMWSARFMKDICTVADPLWQLTKKNVKWQWTEVEQAAFEQLKGLISTRCMSYFRPDWVTEVIVDASPVGLGAVLCQYNPLNPMERYFVCFASRLLTATERRYSQAEKEVLVGVWGPEKFWMYLVGRPFVLVTDNRAVQLIFNSSRSKARVPARIERWALRMTQFDFTVVHRPGSTNVADYYSRHPSSSKSGLAEAFMEEARTEKYINTLVAAALPPAITPNEVWQETMKDKELQELAKWIDEPNRGSYKFPNFLAGYSHVRSELSKTKGGLILRANCLIIPSKLREQIVELAHSGHQGIVKTKRLIRSRVWFPGIDRMVEDRVKRCLECQANTDKQQFEPLKPSKLPERPWHTVCGDFFGPMEDGTYWFHNGDEYSRWGGVEEISSTNSTQVENVLDKLFTLFGAPVIYKTDNGPPFNSYSFREFAKKWGFTHRKVTPEWPRANGEAESFMKKLNKVLKTAKIASTPKNKAVQQFLRVYNETPHSTTQIAPNMLLLGFSRSSGIPSMENDSFEHKAKLHETARRNDEIAKAKMEKEYNCRMRTRESQLKVGSRVLIKLKKNRKAVSAWNVDEPYVVTGIKGSMITASRQGHTTTRNSSFFKLFRFDEENGQTNINQHLNDKTISSQGGAKATPDDQATTNQEHQQTTNQEERTTTNHKTNTDDRQDQKSSKLGRPNKESREKKQEQLLLERRIQEQERIKDPNIRTSSRAKKSVFYGQ
jgi:transposase InsO family protein